MHDENWKRFFCLRQKVFDKIREVDDGCHKSYEGAMDVLFSFKNIYESDSVEETDVVEIQLHCYLLVSGRRATWHGKTFSEALDKAEEGINWILENN